MNSTVDMAALLATARPTLPVSVHSGWTSSYLPWLFIGVFVLVLALFGLLAFLKNRYARRNNVRPQDDFVGSFVQRKRKDLANPPVSVHAPHQKETISVPEVIITPPTPNPGEEERPKGRSHSLDDY